MLRFRTDRPPVHTVAKVVVMASNQGMLGDAQGDGLRRGEDDVDAVQDPGGHGGLGHQLEATGPGDSAWTSTWVARPPWAGRPG